LKFLLEITLLVSPTNSTGSDSEFILRGRSFIYILQTMEALALILGELHVSRYPSQRKNLDINTFSFGRGVLCGV